MSEAVETSVRNELDRLERGLRELKIQYDQFFGGGLKREPQELRAEVERLVRRLAAQTMRRYADRYRMQTLQSRYASLSELWGRTLRAREEGSAQPARARRSRGRVVACCRLGRRTGGDRDRLAQLHHAFNRARLKADPDAATIPFDAFLRGVAVQTGKLRAKHADAEIELRLVVSGGAVKLRARSIGEGAA